MFISVQRSTRLIILVRTICRRDVKFKRNTNFVKKKIIGFFRNKSRIICGVKRVSKTDIAIKNGKSVEIKFDICNLIYIHG